MKRRDKNECVEREFAMDSTTGGESNRVDRGVPSLDSNNNRFSNAVYIPTHTLRPSLQGRSPTWDLQLEQLHRGESLTSFDRETGPYHGSYARFMSPAHPALKFYVTFTPRNPYFVSLPYFTSRICVIICAIIVSPKIPRVNI